MDRSGLPASFSLGVHERLMARADTHYALAAKETVLSGLDLKIGGACLVLAGAVARLNPNIDHHERAAGLELKPTNYRRTRKTK